MQLFCVLILACIVILSPFLMGELGSLSNFLWFPTKMGTAVLQNIKLHTSNVENNCVKVLEHLHFQYGCMIIGVMVKELTLPGSLNEPIQTCC